MDWLFSKLLEQVESAVFQQAKTGARLVIGVNEDVHKLSSSLRTIRAVLPDAERKQLKDGAVKFWLDKVQHIAYDMEDVFDEWNTAILKSQIPGDDPSSSSATLPSKVCSLFQVPIKYTARIVQRRDIANKIKKLNERLQAISTEKDYFAFLVDLGRSNNDLATEQPKTSYFVDVSKIRGRDQDKHTIISMLLSQKYPEERVISIVGMGGMGKTTLAQIVYNHHELTAYFQKKIWVCVSDRFDQMSIAQSILEALTGSASSFRELSTVLEKIRESIAGKRYLLVLDDVWNEDEEKWESLKCCLQIGSQGSKILVTTRKENVATVMGCKRVHQLGKLSQGECWSLLSQIALSGRNDRERENLEDIGKKIADRCDGLPLAAKTLGGLLLFKKYREQWQRILDSRMWEPDEAEKGLFSPLLLSYYDLPLPLRQCFSYCAIFPKDYKIKKDMLIKLWMAQGFLGETRGNEMEIVGEGYFDNLAARSFFQEFEKDFDDDSIIIGCKMHDIVHDFAQLLRKTECCVVPVASNGIEVQRVDFYPENVRHLTFTPPVNKDIEIPDLIYNLKKLRSLLLVDRRYDSTSTLEASLPKLFDQLTCLRMLSLLRLGRRSIKELPQEIGKLIHLRYLSLYGNEELYELPEALCELCNLQTLNIRRCYGLRKLPHGMGKLINLRHLQNSQTRITYFPKGVQRLTCLQTLEKFDVVEKGGGIESETSFSFEDLGKLIHLRGQLAITGLANVGDGSEAGEAQLSTTAGLRKLNPIFDRADYDDEQRMIENEASVLEALHPPQHLQDLSMTGFENAAFPDWMMSLTWLKSVDLSFCYSWERLPPMGKLPFLETLRIKGMMKVKKVGEEFVGVETSSSSSSSSSVDHNIIAFPNLKTLTFQTMLGWEEWEYENVLRSRGGDHSYSSSSNTITIMPKLQLLSIWCCPELKTLPRYILQSRALQKLTIHYSPFLHRRYVEKTGDEWRSISHIPTVVGHIPTVVGEYNEEDEDYEDPEDSEDLEEERDEDSEDSEDYKDCEDSEDYKDCEEERVSNHN